MSEALCEEGLMTVREAAQFLRLSRTRIYRAMKNGDLPYSLFGKARRVPRRALVMFAAKHVHVELQPDLHRQADERDGR